MNAKVINLAHPNHLLHDEYAFLQGIFMTDFLLRGIGGIALRMGLMEDKLPGLEGA